VVNLGGADPFTQRLSNEQQVAHVLNRLSFGARPGDAEAVRRMGAAKWIALQLHPERIAENPELTARLEVIETLRLTPAEVIRAYTPPPGPQAPQLNSLLTPEEIRRVQEGTPQVRTAFLATLDAEKRWRVVAALPASVGQSTPELKAEYDAARSKMTQELAQERRRLMPSLPDLLGGKMMEARSGSKEKLDVIFAGLPPDKRVHVAGQLPEDVMVHYPELRREGLKLRQPRDLVLRDPKDAKLWRALYSNRQLEEVLVDFWYNHFNVDQNKSVIPSGNSMPMLIASYERDAIRPHVLGKFKDLLLATARHPAMLYYLDNWESMANGAVNVGPFAGTRSTTGVMNNPPLARLAHGLNENYGREILELHTLGVNGGYTQEDVSAVARCLTGWTVRDHANPEFVFAPFMHDFGEKTVLGQKIPAGGGEQDGLRALDILAHHPSTAKFISRKLAQRFVADEPPQPLVDRMAQTFAKTDGDVRAVLETMFASTEFLSEGAWLAKIKSPFEMVVSAVRATGGEVTSVTSLNQQIADMGQPLYAKLEPTGYPNTGELWLSTTGTIARVNFAMVAGRRRIPGVDADWSHLKGKDASAIARELLGRDPSGETWAAIKAGLEGRGALPELVAPFVLGSPDFQRR
jgi:uncharacterized protein (DUF1800 family)